MKDIAIYGAGGFGRETASCLKCFFPEDEPHHLVGFFDDGVEKGAEIGYFGLCLGGIDELNAWPTHLDIALCFGDGDIKRKVYEKITNPNISFPNLIHRSFEISDKQTFNIGKGNIITGDCGVTTNVTFGNFNLLNGDVHFGHDCRVGDFNVFMPGSRISGEVTIGNRCLFGAISFVKQQLTIGDGVHLGPLSALLTKPRQDATYIGNPAKRFRI